MFSICSDTSESVYNSTIQTNQTTPFFLTQLAIPYLKESKGNKGKLIQCCFMTKVCLLLNIFLITNFVILHEINIYRDKCIKF